MINSPNFVIRSFLSAVLRAAAAAAVDYSSSKLNVSHHQAREHMSFGKPFAFSRRLGEDMG